MEAESLPVSGSHEAVCGSTRMAITFRLLSGLRINQGELAKRMDNIVGFVREGFGWIYTGETAVREGRP